MVSRSFKAALHASHATNYPFTKNCANIHSHTHMCLHVHLAWHGSWTCRSAGSVNTDAVICMEYIYVVMSVQLSTGSCETTLLGVLEAPGNGLLQLCILHLACTHLLHQTPFAWLTFDPDADKHTKPRKEKTMPLASIEREAKCYIRLPRYNKPSV